MRLCPKPHQEPEVLGFPIYKRTCCGASVLSYGLFYGSMLYYGYS